MRFERLDLNLLVALDALLTECNISVAADRLCLSQSAMSGALARLREFFDDQLLVQSGRRMILTSRAQELAVPVRSVLQQIKSTITTSPVFDPATSDRRFTVMASDYAIMVMLSGALRAIEKLAPGIAVEFVQLDDSPVLRLERREIDLLLTLDHVVSPDHPNAPLFEDDYVVIAWSGNTLLNGHLDRAAYFGLGHVTVQFGKARLPTFEEFFLQKVQMRRRIEVVAPSFTLLSNLVIGTDRIATIQRRLATLVAASSPLVIYEAPLELPRLKQSMQWHESNEQDFALRWLIDQLTAFAQTPFAPVPPIGAIEQNNS